MDPAAPKVTAMARQVRRFGTRPSILPASMTQTLVLALLIGIVAGMRTMTAPAAMSWAASLGWLTVGATRLAFLAYAWTPWVLTMMAVTELVADQHPATPSRKALGPFAARLMSGALSGAAIGVSTGQTMAGLVTGVVGAVVGTLGGYAFRSRLAASFGRDRPAAFIEDAVAIGGALLAVALL
jgi:uncharacterized membrane protein